MSIPYDSFVGAFLSKISEYDLLSLGDEDRMSVVDGFLKRALSSSLLKKVLGFDLASAADDATRTIVIPAGSLSDDDVDEIIDIISEGMLVQWLKPYVYQQELLQNVMNTRDYTMYSPAELLMRVGNAYKKAQSDYTQMLREYSYNHGDLTALHI